MLHSIYQTLPVRMTQSYHSWIGTLAVDLGCTWCKGSEFVGAVSHTRLRITLRSRQQPWLKQRNKESNRSIRLRLCLSLEKGASWPHRSQRRRTAGEERASGLAPRPPPQGRRKERASARRAGGTKAIGLAPRPPRAGPSRLQRPRKHEAL